MTFVLHIVTAGLVKVNIQNKTETTRCSTTCQLTELQSFSHNTRTIVASWLIQPHSDLSPLIKEIPLNFVIKQ